MDRSAVHDEDPGRLQRHRWVLPRSRTARRSLRRFIGITQQVLLEVFFALLPTDLSAFLGVLVRSRGAYVLAAAQLVAGTVLLARSVPAALSLNILKMS
jgi:hypothetical protein